MESQELISLAPEPLIDSVILQIEGVIDMSFDEESPDWVWAESANVITKSIDRSIKLND